MTLARAELPPSGGKGGRVAFQDKQHLEATSPAEREFKDVYESVHDRAINLAARILDDADSAKDVVQQVAVELWTGWEKLELEQHSEAWFLRAVRSRALDERKRRKKHRPLPEESEDELGEQFFVLPDIGLFHEGMLAEEMFAVIVRSMPPVRRLAWTLVKDARCTYHQAAEMLGVSPRTVAKHIELARAYIQANVDRAGIRPSDSTVRALLSARSDEGEGGGA